MNNSILAAAPRDHETQQENETQSVELRLGKDEMNLVEHPFALLRYRDAISKGNALSGFDCEWEYVHPVNGKS